MDLDLKQDKEPSWESEWTPSPPPGHSILFKHRLHTVDFRHITVTGSNDGVGTICSYQVHSITPNAMM